MTGAPSQSGLTVERGGQVMRLSRSDNRDVGEDTTLVVVEVAEATGDAFGLLDDALKPLLAGTLNQRPRPKPPWTCEPQPRDWPDCSP